MRLFVGLGNPGGQYARNRHNIGFMAVDRIAADHGFGPWRAKFQGEVSEGMLGGEKLLLLKPGSFMNRSGGPVQAVAQFYKLTPADIVVFHDELDLAPGRLRVKQGGGHAGHNGLRSISAAIGEGFGRVRLGIGHPGHKDAVANYVLHDFAKADTDWLDDLLRGISDGAAALAAGDSGRFMNAVALRTNPPRPSTGQKPSGQNRGATQPAQAAPKATANTAAPKPGPQKTDPEPDMPQDARGPLQRLIDRFR